MLVNPGPLRTRMRASAMPGEDPRTLRTPAELAPKVLAFCSAEWSETGKLYDFPSDRCGVSRRRNSRARRGQIGLAADAIRLYEAAFVVPPGAERKAARSCARQGR